jgi:hypothetical protein
MCTRGSTHSTRPDAFRKRPAGCTRGESSHDLHVAHESPVGQEALRRIGEFYAIEEDIPYDCPKNPAGCATRAASRRWNQWLDETLA